MEAKLISREDNTAHVEIAVPEVDVERALKIVYNKIASRQNIKGFRQGKAPRHVLNTMFGVESIHAQAMQDLLPVIYSDAMKQLQLMPIDDPDFNPWPVIEEGKDLQVTLQVPVLPEFQICDITRINVDMEAEINADPEEIEATILNMRKSKATFNPVTGRTCRDNDRVKVDYSIKIIDIAGKAPDVEYDNKEGLEIPLGDENLLPEIERKIIGLAIGEEKDFTVKYPENYQNEDLSGQNVSVHIKLHAIDERVLPEIDEAFLQGAGKAASLDDLKERVKKNLQAYKYQIHQSALRERVTSHVLEQTYLEVPQKLIEEEVESRIENLRETINANPEAPSFEVLLAQKGITEDKMREDETKIVAVNLKKRIIFNEIFKNEGMTITPEEMSMALSEYAYQNGIQKSQLKKMMKNRQLIDQMHEDLKEFKVTEFLVSRVRFKGEEAGEAETTATAVDATTEQAAETQSES